MTINVTPTEISLGLRRHGLHCPVALALTRILGEECEVQLAGTFRNVRWDPVDGSRKTRQVNRYRLVLRESGKESPLPPPANRFIKEFDEGLPVPPTSFVMLDPRL